jgi:phenylalanyl-tRNA synthetase alpha chain
MSALLDTLEGQVDEALVAVANAADEPALEVIRLQYLGRKGLIPALMQQLRDVPKEERPTVGKVINEAKGRVSGAIKSRQEALADAAAAAPVTGLDVTLPGRRRHLGRPHPISRIIDECVDIFRRLGFVVATGPDIEDAYHNFDALNTPDDHPARDPQDTFYFADGRLLRTQTSPVQIRTMENQEPPVRIIAPGRCYRRDTPDATHSMSFQQIEGLYIDEQVSLVDLKSILYTFATEFFGEDVKIRLRPHFFPFTEPSIEADFSCVGCNGKGCGICKKSGWLEIAGAGMVDPNVLKTVGYDPEKVMGYAFGMGVERLAMLRYKIPDIRLLYENDVRFLQQL